MTSEELSLYSPVFAFCGGYSSFSFLEKCSAKIPGSSGKFCFGKCFFDKFIAVKDNHWGLSNEDRKYVSMLLGQLLE